MSQETTLKQRQVVTVVVCDISESTRLAENLELEEYSALLHEFRERADGIISDLGGSLIRIDGDGLIFIFGYPDSHEDAPRRAIEAVLRLKVWAEGFGARYAGLGLAVRLHTGIHSGVVLLQDGDLSRGRYEILGDTTNVASRLCSVAGPGEIVISCDALGADRHFFVTTEPELVSIRARQQKQFICRVLGRRDEEGPLAPNLRHSSIPLHGRDREVDWLTGFVERQRPETVAVIRAEAGMGKSRLLSDMLDRCESLHCSAHWSYCSSYRGSAQMDPIWQIGRSLLQALVYKGAFKSDEAEDLQLWDALQADYPADMRMRRDELASLFARAIRTLRRWYSSVLVILDDWHWADSASREFLEIVLEDMPEGLLIVIAERDGQNVAPLPEQAAHLTLEPLTEPEGRKIVEHIAPMLDPLSVSDIFTLSGGNPLFLEELSHAARLSQTARLSRRSDAWLESIVQARYAALKSDEREMLDMAAAIGRVVPRSLLMEVMGSEHTASILESLRQQDFLYPDEFLDRLRFKHGFTRDAVYGLISPARRRELNGKIAATLVERAARQGGTPDPAELARYYFECGETRLAIENSVRAGNIALAALALDKAQYHFQAALEHMYETGPDDEEMVFLIRRYGQSCIVDPKWQMVAVLERLTRQARASGHETSAVWAEYYLAFITYGLGNLEEAIDHYHSVKETAKALGNDSLLRRVHASLGQVYAAACRGDQALTALDRSIAIQRAPRTEDRSPVPLAYSLASKGHLLMDMGRTDEAFRNLAEAANLMQGVRSEAHMSIRAYLGDAMILAGRFEQAESILDSIHAMAQQMRSGFHMVQALSFRNIARFYLERDAAILPEIQVSAEQWALKSQQHTSIVYGHLADAYAQSGMPDRADEFAAKALVRAGMGDRFGETMAYRARALAAHQNGNSEQVSRHLEDAYRSARARGSVRDELLTHWFEAAYLNSETEPPDAELSEMSINPRLFFNAAPKPPMTSSSLKSRQSGRRAGP